ncbi:MAG: Single-stranded DNA-binding protein [Pseudomonadota bacterium]|jgi:single-strand DNA-binding protein
MANLNKVMLIGNLTRDPELRVTPKGTPVATLSLAVNRKWRDEAGADREEVTFVDLEAWGKQGETLAKYLAKGRPLFVEGRLKLDQWEDRDTGQKRQRLKVVVEGFQFLGGRQAGDAQAPAPTGSAAPSPAPKPECPDEDVPF